MTKTANHDEEKPTPPLTDSQVVSAFIAEADEIDREAERYNDPTYRTAAEARRELGRRLAEAQEERRKYVKEAGDRIVKAAENAGRAVADFLNKAYAAAEKHDGQDRK